MHDLLILESFIDRQVVAGYSLRQIFEYWWIGLIILIVAALALAGTYFFLAWLFGRMKFQDGDKEALQGYKKAPKGEKKGLEKQSNKPVRNVIKWGKLAPWLIPVVCVFALILAAGSSFLPSAAFKNLLASTNTREPVIIDTEASRAIGNEGLVGTTQLERNKPYTGWYAPGINIHRSPFAGRNFEYYSEDPLLSGVLAASLSKGTWSKGCYTTIKHFAVNETETHRMGLITWLTEQSLREVYLKGFEIAMKGGIGDTMSHEYFGEEKAVKPVSIMTSFNMIGIKWTGGDYRLCTNILREEWGFEGFVICDFNTCSHMVEKDMFYAGNDLNLESAGVMVWEPNANDPKDVYVLKSCSKNILYVIANSNAVRGQFKVHLPKWQVGMYIGTGVVFAGLVAWGVLVFLRFFKRRKQASVEIQ